MKNFFTTIRKFELILCPRRHISAVSADGLAPGFYYTFRAHHVDCPSWGGRDWFGNFFWIGADPSRFRESVLPMLRLVCRRNEGWLRGSGGGPFLSEGLTRRSEQTQTADVSCQTIAQ
jgi:hypothetical protein